ncbi:MAG: hypothetical protein ACE5FT_04025 [Candidatus Nanoarchaeia archaeon]
MATIFDEPFQFLARMGLLDVVLPFCLIFAVVYGVLQRTEVLKGSSSYKNINRMAAFAISFIAIASAEIVGGITVISIYATMGLVAILMLSVLFGIFGFQPGEAQSGFWVVTIAVGTGLIIYFLDVIGITNTQSVADVIVPVSIIALVFATIIWFITAEEPDVKPEKKAEPAKKPEAPQQGQPGQPGQEGQPPAFETLPGRLKEVGRAKL